MPFTILGAAHASFHGKSCKTIRWNAIQPTSHESLVYKSDIWSSLSPPSSICFCNGAVLSNFAFNLGSSHIAACAVHLSNFAIPHNESPDDPSNNSCDLSSVSGLKLASLVEMIFKRLSHHMTYDQLGLVLVELAIRLKRLPYVGIGCENVYELLQSFLDETQLGSKCAFRHLACRETFRRRSCGWSPSNCHGSRRAHHQKCVDAETGSATVGTLALTNTPLVSWVVALSSILYTPLTTIRLPRLCTYA